MLNERDRGINGVMLHLGEVRDRIPHDRGVECYERSKNKGPTGASVIHPLSPHHLLLIREGDRRQDPGDPPGLRRTDAADGRVFPYISR